MEQTNSADASFQPITNLMDSEHKESSKRQDKSARSKFNAFLKQHVGISTSMDTLSCEDVTKDLLGKFTTFLLNNPQIQHQTSMNYLSSIRRQLETTKGTMLFNNNEKWYKKLRKNLDKHYMLLCVKEGKNLKDQAPIMTMNDLSVIGNMLFMKNSRIALKDRTLLNQQWNAIGRSSDIGCLSFDQLTWMDGYILVRLNRLKIRKQQSLAVFCSALKWEIDPFHSLACQLAGDPFNVSNLLFNQIGGVTQKEDKVAAYINQLLRNLTRDCDSSKLTQNLKFQSSRRGSAVQACSNVNVNLSDVAHRGKWTLDGFSTLFEYIAETCAADHKVARVLAGWENAQHAVHPPQLVCAHDGMDVRVAKEHFARTLFAHYLDRLSSQQLSEVHAASLLMYIHETQMLCAGHIVHTAMLAAVQDASPHLHQEQCWTVLGKWGSDIRREFVMNNMVALPVAKVKASLCEGELDQLFVSAHTFEEILTRLVGAVRAVAGEIVSVRSDLQSMRELLVASNQTIASLHDMILTLQTTSAPTRTGDFSEITHPPEGPKQWPANLNTLAGVSLSSVIYQHYCDQLEKVPYDSKNRQQTEVRSAMMIARRFIGSNEPTPLAHTSSHAERRVWKSRVKQLAASTQNEILAHLDRLNTTSTGTNKRKLTGTVSGIVRAWHQHEKRRKNRRTEAS